MNVITFFRSHPYFLFENHDTISVTQNASPLKKISSYVKSLFLFSI